MAAMCSESKPWTLRSLSLPLVSYMTLANSFARPSQKHTKRAPRVRAGSSGGSILLLLRAQTKRADR